MCKALDRAMWLVVASILSCQRFLLYQKWILCFGLRQYVVLDGFWIAKGLVPRHRSFAKAAATLIIHWWDGGSCLGEDKSPGSNRIFPVHFTYFFMDLIAFWLNFTSCVSLREVDHCAGINGGSVVFSCVWWSTPCPRVSSSLLHVFLWWLELLSYRVILPT